MKKFIATLLLFWPVSLFAQTTFTLNWTPGVIDATHPAPTGFNVYRCPDVKIGATAVSVLNFVDVQTLPGGTQVCYAVSAFNNDGESSKLQAFGTVPSNNAAPVVGAGPDQTITLPAGATLNGTVTDDGLPNNTLTVKWSQVLGPGVATFANPTSTKTTVTFSAPGSYVLNIQAYDGALFVADDVLILVNPAPQPPPAMPTNVAASLITGSSLVLNWTDNATNETRQEVMVQQVTPWRTYLIPIAADATTLPVTGLRKNAQYRIQVRTINDSGASAWSPILTVVTLKK